MWAIPSYRFCFSSWSGLSWKNVIAEKILSLAPAFPFTLLAGGRAVAVSVFEYRLGLLAFMTFLWKLKEERRLLSSDGLVLERVLSFKVSFEWAILSMGRLWSIRSTSKGLDEIINSISSLHHSTRSRSLHWFNEKQARSVQSQYWSSIILMYCSRIRSRTSTFWLNRPEQSKANISERWSILNKQRFSVNYFIDIIARRNTTLVSTKKKSERKREDTQNQING